MPDLTLDDVTSHRDRLEARLLDLLAERAYLELQLARAEADGDLISIQAVRQALAPEPPDTHRVVFPHHPVFHIRHPEDCDAGSCAVEAAAQRTLTLAAYAPAVYECWVGTDGWLCTREAP